MSKILHTKSTQKKLIKEETKNIEYRISKTFIFIITFLILLCGTLYPIFNETFLLNQPQVYNFFYNEFSTLEFYTPPLFLLYFLILFFLLFLFFCNLKIINENDFEDKIAYPLYLLLILFLAIILSKTFLSPLEDNRIFLNFSSTDFFSESNIDDIKKYSSSSLDSEIKDKRNINKRCYYYTYYNNNPTKDELRKAYSYTIDGINQYSVLKTKESNKEYIEIKERVICIDPTKPNLKVKRFMLDYLEKKKLELNEV